MFGLSEVTEPSVGDDRFRFGALQSLKKGKRGQMAGQEIVVHGIYTTIRAVEPRFVSTWHVTTSFTLPLPKCGRIVFVVASGNFLHRGDVPTFERLLVRGLATVERISPFGHGVFRGNRGRGAGGRVRVREGGVVGGV